MHAGMLAEGWKAVADTGQLGGIGRQAARQARRLAGRHNGGLPGRLSVEPHQDG